MKYKLFIEKAVLKTVEVDVPDTIDNEEDRVEYVEKQYKKHNEDLNPYIKDSGCKVTSTLIQIEGENVCTNWFTPDYEDINI